MDTPMHKEIDLNMGIRRGYGQGYRTVQLWANIFLHRNSDCVDAWITDL
jgi:hypothetical protein